MRVMQSRRKKKDQLQPEDKKKKKYEFPQNNVLSV